MQYLDILIILVYLFCMVLIGLYANKKQVDMEDYYVAGKSIGKWTVMCLWVSYWIGGATMVGTVQNAYSFGIGATAYPFIIALGLLIFGLTAAGPLNKLGSKLNYVTLPDMLEDRYDSRTRIISTIITIIIYIAYTAAQLVASASIFSVLTGWSLLTCYIVSTLVVVVYTSMGGFLAVTYTDWVQLGLLILGICIITFPATIMKTGGVGNIISTLPAEHFQVKTYGTWSLVAMFITTILCFYTNMDSFTRCFAAKSEEDAKSGTLWAALIVALIAIIVTVIGLATKVILPDLADSSTALSSLVFELFPPGVRSLALVGVMSAIMSSADICLLTASANFTNDIYSRYLNKKAEEKTLVRVGIMSSFGIGLLSALLAWFVPNVIGVLFIGITIAAATLFFPIIFGLFWNKANSVASFWSMMASLIVVVLWSVMKIIKPEVAIFQMDAAYPGLVMSAIVFFTLSYTIKPGEKEKKRIKDFLEVIN